MRRNEFDAVFALTYETYPPCEYCHLVFLELVTDNNGLTP